MSEIRTKWNWSATFRYWTASCAEQTLPAILQLVRVLRPNRELMYTRAESCFSSVTALAETIQSLQHVSYRSAHRVVAPAVLLAVEENRTATEIDAAMLNRVAQETIGRALTLDGAAIATCLNPHSFVESHAGAGCRPTAMVCGPESKLCGMEKQCWRKPWLGL